jgi:hypothetical protein
LKVHNCMIKMLRGMMNNIRRHDYTVSRHDFSFPRHEYNVTDPQHNRISVADPSPVPFGILDCSVADTDPRCSQYLAFLCFCLKRLKNLRYGSGRETVHVQDGKSRTQDKDLGSATML